MGVRVYDVDDTAANAPAHVSYSVMLAHCAHMVLFSNLMFSSSGGAQASPERERESEREIGPARDMDCIVQAGPSASALR